MTEDKKEPEENPTPEQPPQSATPEKTQTPEEQTTDSTPEKQKSPDRPLSIDEKLDLILKRQDGIDEAWANLHTDVSNIVDKVNYIDGFITEKIVPTLNRHSEFQNALIKDIQNRPKPEATAEGTPAEVPEGTPGQQSTDVQFQSAMRDLQAQGGDPNHPFMGILQRIFEGVANNAVDSVFGPKPTLGQVYNANVFPELQRKWMEGMLVEQNTNIEVGKAIVDRVRGKLQTKAADELVSEITESAAGAATKGVLTG